MERHEERTARVIPIILKPVDWKKTPFSKLATLPKDAKAITTWRNQDEAFLDVVTGIRRAAESLQAKKESFTDHPIALQSLTLLQRFFNDSELDDHCQGIIRQPHRHILVSSAAAWETATK